MKSKRGRSPSPKSVTLIEAAAEAIEPTAALADWYRGYVNSHASRLAADVEMVRRCSKPPGAILDVGAAPFVLSVALHRAGYEVQAVDIDPERLNVHGPALLRCDIETEPLPVGDASIDLVVFNEVLEHLRINPVFSLREVHRALKPGGILLLSTPNMRSLSGLTNLLRHQQAYAVAGPVLGEYAKLETLGHMGHVREYAPGDVSRLLEGMGFRIDSIVFSGRHRRRVGELLLQLTPQFRRYATYVARKRLDKRPDSVRPLK